MDDYGQNDKEYSLHTSRYKDIHLIVNTIVYQRENGISWSSCEYYIRQRSSICILHLTDIVRSLSGQH